MLPWPVAPSRSRDDRRRSDDEACDRDAERRSDTHEAQDRTDSERRPQAIEVSGAEHHPVAGSDVHEVEIDTGLGDLAGQVGEHTGTIFDIDDHDLALAADRQMRDRQRVPGGARVRYENVQLSLLA